MKKLYFRINRTNLSLTIVQGKIVDSSEQLKYLIGSHVDVFGIRVGRVPHIIGPHDFDLVITQIETIYESEIATT